MGLDGSADLLAARRAAEHLGTRHHEYVYSAEEADRALPNVIAHLESYDPALIRSAVPCYFVSKLTSEHVKVVLTGEGSDEAFAGYRYFRHRLGGPVMAACLVLLAGGIATFLWIGSGENAGRAWGAVIANWLFFAGISAGALAFRAALQLTGAKWAASLRPLTGVATGFIPIATIVLVGMVIGAGAWAPWTHHVAPAKSFWLNSPFFAARQLGGAALLLWLGFRVIRNDRADTASSLERRSQAWAMAYCLAYAVVLSVWSFDFILALDEEWVSTLIGPHLFMGALLGGVAFVTVCAVLARAAESGQRHDLGKLCFGLSVFWVYLLWSQYLPIWYGNLPEETGFVLRRTEPPWRAVSLCVVMLTFVVPFAGLMHERVKRNSRALAAFAAAALLGLWLERQLLVLPSLTGQHASPVAASDVLIALGFLAAFVLSVARSVPSSEAASPPPAT